MNEDEIITLLNSEYRQCRSCKKVFHFMETMRINSMIHVAHYETCFLCDWGHDHRSLLIKMNLLQISLEDIEKRLYNNLYKLHIENQNHIIAVKR